jgi:hypothetical protein
LFLITSRDAERVAVAGVAGDPRIAAGERRHHEEDW